MSPLLHIIKGLCCNFNLREGFHECICTTQWGLTVCCCYKCQAPKRESIEWNWEFLKSRELSLGSWGERVGYVCTVHIKCILYFITDLGVKDKSIYPWSDLSFPSKCAVLHFVHYLLSIPRVPQTKLIYILLMVNSA